MARRIAAAGHRVVVLESGEAEHRDAAQALNEIEDPGNRYTRSLSGRHRGLGGTSSRWGGRMIPVSDYETGPRRELDEEGWPMAPRLLAPYQREIETIFRVAGGSFDTMPFGADAFPADADTFHPRWAKCPSFANCNLATLLRGELKGNGNIEIWLDATVTDFRLDRANGRLEALVARSLSGKQLFARARHFVVAAGTIETTRLLLLLDRASEERAFARTDALGRFFQDHLKAEVATIDRSDPVATNRLFAYRFVNGTRRDLHLDLSASAQKADKVSGAFAYISMDLAESALASIKKVAHGLQRRQLRLADVGQASTHLGTLARSAYWRLAKGQLYVPPAIKQRIFVCVEQLPRWSNRITLGQSLDPLGVPRARLEWGPTEADERTFRTTVSRLKQYWAKADFDTLCPLNLSPAARNADQPIIAGAEACAHPSGSARMGTNPASSVTRPDLRCHDVNNLSVVGAAVFPTAGSANPTFTIMQLAHWAADQHLGLLARSADASGLLHKDVLTGEALLGMV
ncbi:MAG: GMC family oxidoreductase [Methylobacterium mesophilicum]|nr:GMC family oxidoreductase [Methylobacterium mesophilicum]